MAADPAALVLTRCPECGGVGEFFVRDKRFEAGPITLMTCPTCHGTGQIPAGQTEERG